MGRRGPAGAGNLVARPRPVQRQNPAGRSGSDRRQVAVVEEHGVERAGRHGRVRAAAEQVDALPAAADREMLAVGVQHHAARVAQAEAVEAQDVLDAPVGRRAGLSSCMILCLNGFG